ncbi:MAG: hypothetical protein O9335_07380 [Inhella sp.]|uniref:hypothetical protein n=1 Tax=Inhella sp. TaxID=1921806 RepID=UPI0022BD45F1|nr:hypothetical protein [Inhella sp.]MCZ8234963.1 hypothetical protein [Inhella sp.]
MYQPYFTWQVLSFLGGLLCFVGLFFIPSDLLVGVPANVLALFLGFVLFVLGVLWGFVRAVKRFRGPGSLGQRLGLSTPPGQGFDDDDDHRRRADDRRGPLVNIDGTPMASAHVDINGNAFGVTEHRYDAGGFSSGGSFGGGFSNSRW